MKNITIFWFRRDLRVEDNTALYNALNERGNVLPLFIFDSDITDHLADKKDLRISFLFDEVTALKREFESHGSSLLIKYGKPADVFDALAAEYKISAVYTNHDYEPYATKRDEKVRKLMQSKGVDFKAFKDQVIFEKDEVVKDDGKPYTVFTPYSRKWKAALGDGEIEILPSEKLLHKTIRTSPFPDFRLAEAGLTHQNFIFPERVADGEIIRNYHKTRDIPSLKGTSRLSLHLRFGTISIRKLVKFAIENNETYLNELIWREFYMMILWHFPHVVDHAFKPQYDNVKWLNNEDHFAVWCGGRTGYPIVDAGMRQLNQTGYMHNRVRMITASFLVKHLLIDWRWGEAYFAQKLLDYELSSNNGGWQWAAGSGCDAAPYFRVFNPELQTKKFDPKFEYIRQWVPEFEDFKYPKPIVAHKFARERVLEEYKRALNEAN
jgi:deoxyribodipyrimidine photo-lyase